MMTHPRLEIVRTANLCRRARQLVVLELCLVGLLAACNQPSANENAITVGVSLLTREHVYYSRIEKAVSEEAEQLGFHIIFKDANRDSNLQMSQVQDFITVGVDAIILSPTASAGIAPAIQLAQKSGIPVFTMDIAAEGNVTSHVGTDNRKGGRLAGEYTAKKILQGNGKVAIITYAEVESCVNREQGFVEVVDEYPGIEVVDIQNCSGSMETSASLTQNLLVQFPDLDVIFGVGDPFAMGAYTTIKAEGRDTKVIGFDGNPEAIAEIKKGGLWIADIAQDPDAIGRSAVRLVRDHLEGQQIPTLKLIEPTVVDQQSL